MLFQAIDTFRAWFLDEALPLWRTYGVDHVDGGFFEKLDINLSSTNEPRRTRLVSRQIFLFSVGKSLGWDGPVDSLVDHGLKFLLDNLVRSDGQVYASCSSAGLIVDERQHLYDVAFVLIALSKLALRYPDSVEPEELARRITMRLEANPFGGYYDEITPDQQCSNPHMHLFEAFLAWASLKTDEQLYWSNKAAGLAQLALERLIIPQLGLLPEFFDRYWCPLQEVEGQRIEPGHQFEWSWLLARWGVITSDSRFLAAGARLCNVAEKYGVDSARNVAIESINSQLLPTDQTARLWQQTERLKAWHLHWALTSSLESRMYCEQSLASLLRFFSGPKAGLWFDEMDSEGHFVPQPIKASSGYHIACALEVLCSGVPSY